MSHFKRAFPFLASAVLLSGCASLAPEFSRPALPVPINLPGHSADAERAELISWDDAIGSPQLAELTQLALSENRDLRIAVANVALARAQYGITEANRLPTIKASGTQTFSDSHNSNSQTGFRDSVVAQLGMSAYELDFFGRVKNLNDAALQSYLATTQGARSARISIAASVAEIWLRLAADRELLALAENTAMTQGDSLDLTRQLFDAGLSNELDVRRASSSVETAKAQAAAYKTQVLQDLNALRLVVGTDLPPKVESLATLSPTPIQVEQLANLSSNVLLNRPDVMAAEYRLRAANANIGAARAAMFPSISLTTNIGLTASSFQDLIENGTSYYSLAPQISLPIFDSGARRKNIEASEASRDIAISTYEKTIQTAFKETADALAVSQTIGERIAALEQLGEDSEVTYNLSMERLKVGVDDYLSVLDAQRATFSARQQLILARLDQALNQVALYRAVGAAPK